MGKIIPYAAAAATFFISGGNPTATAAAFQIGNLIVGKQGSSSAPQAAPAAAPANTVTQAPVDAITSAQTKTAQAALSSNYMTAGGAEGEELSPDQVQKRASLFGN